MHFDVILQSDRHRRAGKIGRSRRVSSKRRADRDGRGRRGLRTRAVRRAIRACVRDGADATVEHTRCTRLGEIRMRSFLARAHDKSPSGATDKKKKHGGGSRGQNAKARRRHRHVTRHDRALTRPVSVRRRA